MAAETSAADIDLSHALPIDQARAALAGVQLAFEAMGSPDLSDRVPAAAPRDRMGLVAARPIAPGEPLGEHNVRFAFPAAGLPVERWDEFVGRSAVRPIPADQPIAEGDLAP